MRAAHRPLQRPANAKLLVADVHGRLHHARRSELVEYLRPGDLLVANDAATMPASLSGVHQSSGGEIEVRLAGRSTLDVDAVCKFTAVVFGAGDHRTRTEERACPPALRAGDHLVLGPLRATVIRLLGHARLVVLRFKGTPDAIWAGIANHGRPIQYAHIDSPLAMWDVWTRVAALPVAFEPPSAGFVLDWRMMRELEARGVGFATLTHAAGISSTGDEKLDALLPLDEPYDLPLPTVRAIERTLAAGGRVAALGTTVTRALEHAALGGGRLRMGPGVATQRIGPATELRVVDTIISGAHVPGESHYELLRAFMGEVALRSMSAALERMDYRTHEFGDSVMIERVRTRRSCPRRSPAGTGHPLAGLNRLREAHAGLGLAGG